MAKKQFDAKSSAEDRGAKRRRLEEIQQQMNDMGIGGIGKPAAATKPAAPYDEFYKATTERGFTKITIPKTRTGNR
ncbi:MAG: hypothetical protein GC185_05665 [Alphaproteobacteria bacterium]|nr:hypothetical protein [Alphaproteobacteria bacterium]